MKQKPFTLKDRLSSFTHAINGILILLREEHNSRIHLVALVSVVIAGLVFGISTYEWIAVIMVSGLVLSLEAVNSAMENLLDYVSPEWHEKVKKIKDVIAGAVLIASATALITGVVIFLPRIVALF
ncbi:MAG TPA: diacylglycerol kinase family protein [Bacteroidales bacterium]|nr:diacylglycerol kinase family protein [Bacteroidales bacterium]